MPLIFPTNPSASQAYQSGSSATYRWNGVYWVTDVAPTATVITATSASFASTGSSINTLNQSVIVSGSFTVFTGSAVELQVLDNGVRLGNLITDGHQVTGSLQVTGSITGSLFGTASFARSSSFTTTASYAVTAGRTFESAVIISGSTANPVKGTSRTVDRIILVDDGSGLCTVTMNYYQSNAGSAGTGDYLFVLPGGYQFDIAYHSAFAVAGDPNLSGNESWIPGGSGKITSVAANLMAAAYAQVWDATRFRILMGGEMLFGTDARIRTPVGAGFFSLAGTGTGFQMSFTFKKV